MTLIALLGGGALAGLPNAAMAQSCPANLAALSGQIQTPDLQTVLSISIDDIITQAGGLDQAIINTSQRLSRFSAIQANLGNADDDATRLYVNESVVVVTAQLQALQCRKGS
ncbi:MAG TPA: hypothetical protein VF459_16655 [Caulobacteraceae bacterium]